MREVEEQFGKTKTELKGNKKFNFPRTRKEDNFFLVNSDEGKLRHTASDERPRDSKPTIHSDITRDLHIPISPNMRQYKQILFELRTDM